MGPKLTNLSTTDGNPLPHTNPSDRQKLIQATMKYKGSLEAAEKRAKAAQLKLNEAKQHTHKYLALAKQSQREAMVAIAALKKKKMADEAKLKPGGSDGQMAARVKDTIAAFSLTAEKRREQLNKKRTAYTSSTWLQSLPRVSLPLRKSLWHKMHRRRQQIVLRPSPEALANELRRNVKTSLEKLDSWKPRDKKVLESELEKAEQTFYLATHPVLKSGENVSAVPSSSSWAEPGMYLSMICVCHILVVDSDFSLGRLSFGPFCSQTGGWYPSETTECSVGCEESLRAPFCSWTTSC